MSKVHETRTNSSTQTCMKSQVEISRKREEGLKGFISGAPEINSPQEK